eukprot:598912-Pelagomonas_calceolata.AAC.2
MQGHKHTGLNNGKQRNGHRNGLGGSYTLGWGLHNTGNSSLKAPCSFPVDWAHSKSKTACVCECVSV